MLRRPALAVPGGGLALSPRAYWLLAGLLIAAYLTIWLARFQSVYGWVNDDYYLFTKGMMTLGDWRSPFTYSYNALHAYFYLVSFLPLWSGISLPSYPLPMLGEQTGQFRFLLLYTVLLHVGLLGLWAWLAPRLGAGRLTAFLSLLLLASSPTFVLWTPQPESRLLGLPFALVGFWVLLRLDAGAESHRRLLWWAFAAGSLMSLAQGVHYTALYLIAPVCLVFWALWLWPRRRQAAAWLALLGFGAGLVWWPLLIEAVSYLAVGLAWDKGPLMTLLSIRRVHTSPWDTLGSLSVWVESAWSQMGPLMLLGIVSGWYAYLRWPAASGGAAGRARLVLALSIPAAVTYLCVSGSMPFFRQSSVLQPFLFLFAAAGVVQLTARLPVARVWRGGVVVLLVGGIAAVQWGQAGAVFAAHHGLGSALEWAYAHKGERGLQWARIAWFGGATELDSLEQLRQAPADNWVISYFPFILERNFPSLQAYIAATPPVAAWPSLFATDTLRAEHKGYGFNDFRADPLFHDIRITPVGALRQAMEGRPLPVSAVRADSQASAETEAANVLDHDNAADGHTAWRSAPTAGPHHLDVEFTASEPIGALDVVLPTRDQGDDAVFKDQVGSRIEALDVQVRDGDGTYRTVWAGRGLDRYPVIQARWAPAAATGVRLIVGGQRSPVGQSPDTSIEELVFPGYAPQAPALQRPSPPLILNDLGTAGGVVTVDAEHLTPQTVLVLDGVRMAVRPSGTNQQFTALDSQAQSARLNSGAPVEAYLTDGTRRSNLLRLSAPGLPRLEPASVPAVLGAGPADEATLPLAVSAEGVTPRTAVRFDGVTLEATLQDATTLVTQVPAAFLAAPGPHSVWLHTPYGDSDRVEFRVTEPLAAAPELVGIDPPAAVAAGPSGPAAAEPLTLTLTAKNVTAGTAATLDAVMLPTVPGASNTLVARVPPEFLTVPGRHAIRLRNASGESNGRDFEVIAPVVLPPVVKRVSPNPIITASLPAEDDRLPLRVDGDGIGPATIVVFESVMLPTTLEHDGTVTAMVPRAFLATPGRYALSLRNGAAASNPVELVVAEAAGGAPALQGLEPPGVLVGQAFEAADGQGSLLRLTAERATPASVVTWDGVTLKTEFQDEGALLARVPSEFLAIPGRHAIRLKNSSGESNVVDFVVTEGTGDAPVVQGLAPARAIVNQAFDDADGQGSRLRITAERATPWTVVTWDGVGLPTEFEDEDTLVARVPRAFLAGPGAHAVRLKNSLGASNAAAFLVVEATAGPPALNGITPAAARAHAAAGQGTASSLELRIDAANVTPQTVVLLDGVRLPTTYQDEHTLVASMPGEFLAYPTRHRITLHNSTGESDGFDFVVQP